MIRPLTVICCVLAGGTVLYTFQAKHAVQLLDRQIEKTLADTASLREQSRTLKAEFTLRENPERLRTFADQYLSLKPMLPTQFATIAELDARLPAPRAMGADTRGTDTTDEPVEAPVASTPKVVATTENPTTTPDELPIPPLPVPPPSVVLAIVQTPAVPKPAAAPRPPAMLLAAPVPAPAHTLPIQAAPIQAAPLQAAPLQAQAVRAPAPPAQIRSQFAATPPPQPAQTGSMLGMAYSGLAAPVPVPRPMPVSSPQWTNGN